MVREDTRTRRVAGRVAPVTTSVGELVVPAFQAKLFNWNRHAPGDETVDDVCDRGSWSAQRRGVVEGGLPCR